MNTENKLRQNVTDEDRLDNTVEALNANISSDLEDGEDLPDNALDFGAEEDGEDVAYPEVEDGEDVAVPEEDGEDSEPTPVPQLIQIKTVLVNRKRIADPDVFIAVQRKNPKHF